MSADEPLPGVSTALYQYVIDPLNAYGAKEWNPWTVAVITALVLLVIRVVLGKSGGVDWLALIHAVPIALGSVVCLWLDAYASDPSAPLRAIECLGPLTSLHRLLPAMTMGYSLFDVLNGLDLGWDFIFHGFITVSCMWFFIVHDGTHIISPLLCMEVSTVFLAMVKAPFPPALSVANQLCFAFSFFLFRIIIAPYVWFGFIWQFYKNRSTQTCFPTYFLAVSFMIGMSFHLLNLFWFYKIVRKIVRKVRGSETYKDTEISARKGEEEKKKK